MIRGFEEFFIKWFLGYEGLNSSYQYREYGRTIGAMKTLTPRFERNIVETWSGILPLIKEKYKTENHYLSIAFYKEPKIENPRFYYIYYDLDDKKHPKRAIKKGFELAWSLKKRFGAEPILVLSGKKGIHVIVPVKPPIDDFERYRYIWNYLIQPYNIPYIDTKVCEPRRIHRIPYTYNIKSGKRSYSIIVDMKGKMVQPMDFDWSNYEPLDINQIRMVRVSSETPEGVSIYLGKKKKRLIELPKEIEKLAMSDAVPECIRNIIRTFNASGDIDHFQRIALVLYLKWIGFSVDAIVEYFRRHAQDFNETVTRYQVEYLFGLRGKREDWIMYGCKKMKELNMCLNCGWDRNPVTYTYARAVVPEELKEKFFNKIKNNPFFLPDKVAIAYSFLLFLFQERLIDHYEFAMGVRATLHYATALNNKNIEKTIKAIRRIIPSNSWLNYVLDVLEK